VGEVNLLFGWAWVLVGLVLGAVAGVFFYDANWLGGYGSWRRRMVRLGHISFLGTGLLNLGFVFTFALKPSIPPTQAASLMFVAGGATMRLVCYLSAWKDRFRFLFVIPVASLIAAAVITVLAVCR